MSSFWPMIDLQNEYRNTANYWQLFYVKYNTEGNMSVFIDKEQLFLNHWLFFINRAIFHVSRQAIVSYFYSPAIIF